MTDKNKSEDPSDAEASSKSVMSGEMDKDQSADDDQANDLTLKMLAGMSRRQQRKVVKHLRKEQRRDKWSRFRGMWVERAVDQPLPDRMQNRIPAWVERPGGRWAVIGIGALILILWMLFMLWVIS